ncbi:hypothetical protein PsorP6_008763 [Peronosclerospora sorghi]|uniref:Uncharacterized protein n=1 Tax=Peronosclerospora sorghi TaxID=230839 RepID=A0ACC0VZG3_9STRA|nr:hypothetical protein PsorP6_008763 [Peronosclerospora sorghi]
MTDDVAWMRELFARSLHASGPQRSAAENELKNLHHIIFGAPFLASLLEMCVVVPNADGTPRNLVQLTSEDADVRLSAVLWIKHYIKAHWRTRKAGNVLSDKERIHVREVLLFAALHEPLQTVALHLSLIVATIARADFPTHCSFETLFPMMLYPLKRLNGAVDVAKEKRGVDVCFRVVKELASKRLMQNRKQFAMLSVKLLPLLLQFWTMTATELNEYLEAQRIAGEGTNTQKIEALSSSLATGGEQLNLLMTSTKLISTMLFNAFRDLSSLQNGELVRSALIEFYNQLKRLVNFRQALHVLIGEASEVNLTLEVQKMMLTLGKCMHRIASIAVGVQQSYSIEFREFLPAYLTLFWDVLVIFASTPGSATHSLRQLKIDSLQFFTNVLSCRLYKNECLSGSDGTTTIMMKVITATGDVELTNTMVLEAQAAVQTFFKAENRFASLVNLLVMRYMVMAADDLEEWRSNPEAYYALIESLTAKESVRACAENVFLTLVQHYPAQTIPVLKEMIVTASIFLNELARGQTATVCDDRRILDTDAILLAIGLSCYDLHDCFDFEPWFLSNLVPILFNSDAAVGSFFGKPVLRFRIVWLISCWLAQLSANVRPPLYDALLNPSALFQGVNADVALHLRVFQTLELMVDDWGFEADAFVPFLPRALECLFAFFPRPDEPESKMKMLCCLEAIIRACGVHIIRFCHQISASLPALWSNESDASNLVRGKVLQLMSQLLSSVNKAEKSHSDGYMEDGSVQALWNMCVQVIKLATDVSNPDEVFLMENGLELWDETLQAASAYCEELHLLFRNVLRLAERDYEHVGLMLSLMEHYVKLGKTQFWHAYHSDVSRLLHNVIGNVRKEASVLIVRVAETIVVTIPITLLGEFVPVTKVMIDACIAFQQGAQKSEPETILAGYMSVVTRLMMIDFDYTLKTLLLNNYATLSLLVDTMLRLYYTVGSSPLTLSRRKVWAFAMCSTLKLTEQHLLEKTGQILAICVEVIEDEQDEQKQRQKTAIENHDENNAGLGVFSGSKAHYNSQQRLREDDVSILNLDSKQFLCGTLNDLAIKLGSTAFEQLLQTVDSSVLYKLQSQEPCEF